MINANYIEKAKQPLLDMFKQHEIPDTYSQEFLTNVYSLLVRDEFISAQGFTLLAKDWVEQLAKWIGDRPCLEIMAGCGSLSASLQKYGVNVHATDNYSWGLDGDCYVPWHVFKTHWTTVEKIDAIAAIEKYNQCALLIVSWPYVDDTAYRVLMKMREVNPNCIMLYIGEDRGGCTANEQFFIHAESIMDEDISKINNIYPRWRGNYDHIYLIK